MCLRLDHGKNVNFPISMHSKRAEVKQKIITPGIILSAPCRPAHLFSVRAPAYPLVTLTLGVPGGRSFTAMEKLQFRLGGL